MTEQDVLDIMVRPSPGETGAFRCSICGSAHVGVVVNSVEAEVYVRIVCRECRNFLDFVTRRDNGSSS